jgi:succinate dehydrogenase / fumarate reductase cytochrome b subunit
MSKFFSSSIGRKVVMALSGFFLIVFLLVHLTANLTLLIGPETFNAASEFMGTNPLIQIMQPVLALGFLVHIVMGVVLEYQNRKATPTNYDVTKRAHASGFSSRYMIHLGVLILLFLVLHLKDYFFVMKFGSMEGQTDYQLVSSVLGVWWYGLAYIAFFVVLGLHLDHGFQSAFQTMGLNNQAKRRALIVISRVFSLIIAVGFSVIALFFMLNLGA